MGGRGGDGGGGSGIGGPQSNIISGKATMDNVEAAMPGYYESPGQYQTGEANSKDEQHAHNEIIRSKGNPNRMVRVFRPVGEYRDLKEFQSGRGIDVNHSAWVSTSYEQAQERAGPSGSVGTFQTQASNLSTTGQGSTTQWTYDGPSRRNVSEAPEGRVNRYRRP